MNFRCNYRKCRKELNESAIVTSCSHIFCLDHSPVKISKELNSAIKRKEIKCPVCKANLNQTFDFVEVELQPPDAFKGMVLTGLKPETIIEIAARALGFWMYQMEQELQYNQYIIKKQSEKAKLMEHEFMNAYNSLNEENNFLKSEKENLCKECEELREKLIVESRNLEKLKAELKYYSIQEKQFPKHHQSDTGIGNKIHQNFFSIAGQQQQYSSIGGKMINSYLHKSNSMMISPDSTFGSPSKSALHKTEHANRIWGISNNQYSRPLKISNEPQQSGGRKYLSPLDNILNKKLDISNYPHRRLPNSLESINSSQISFGFS